MEEVNKLLDVTIEFSRYMQQDVLVVNRFLDEYLYYNTGEYLTKLLALLQWMTSMTITGIFKRIYYEIFYKYLYSNESNFICSTRIIYKFIYIYIYIYIQIYRKTY